MSLRFLSLRSTRRCTVVALLATGLVPVTAYAATGAASQQEAPPGSATLFDTWTGYPTGHFLEGVAAGDFNDDGAPDVAWASASFVDNQMLVQLNRGDGTMGSPVGYPAVDQSNDIAAGDIDGDDDLDLVVVSQGNSLANETIDLYLNDGMGRFVHRTTQGGKGPKKLVLADFNGDGRPDIAVTNYWSGGSDVSVLLNRGDGTFRAERRIPIGTHPNGIAAADLDGDGDRDLAVGRADDSATATVHLLLNNGKGRFAEKKAVTLGGVAGDPVVAAADWDGDGDPDLGVSGLGAARLWVLSSAGGLKFRQSSYPAGFSAFDLRVADIDSDGDPDVLGTDYSSDAGEFVLLRNNGGAFDSPVSIESGRNPHDMDVADFDGDGRPDIVVANRVTDTGAVHLQRSDGTFSASTTVPPIYSTPFAPYSLVDTDVDLDGDVDVVATLPDFFGDGDTVQVMLNDGKGRFTPGDSIASNYDYPQGLAVGDFNDDGYPDLVWTPDQPPYPYVYALNNGDGTYDTPVVGQTLTCGTGDASTADVDNDGDIDLIIPNNRGGPGCEAFETTARIVLNNGHGTFGTDYGVEFKLGQEHVLGTDLNSDGKTDLMSATPQNGIVKGTGGGAFGKVVLTPVRGTDLVARDLDADGDLDVVSGDSSFSQTTVMRNNGHGGFTRYTIYPSEQVSGYSNAWDVALGDFDDDGKLDIAVSNTSGNNVGLHFGNGKGAFNKTQVRYGTHANPLDLVVADFDGDGRSDIVTGAAIGSSFVTPRGISVLLNRGGSALAP